MILGTPDRTVRKMPENPSARDYTQKKYSDFLDQLSLHWEETRRIFDFGFRQNQVNIVMNHLGPAVSSGEVTVDRILETTSVIAQLNGGQNAA